MPQSTVQIQIEEQRERYYKALNHKISDFKRYIATSDTEAASHSHDVSDIKRYLVAAISLKNLFEIKCAVVTLTRDDLDLLTRILNTSA